MQIRWITLGLASLLLSSPVVASGRSDPICTQFLCVSYFKGGQAKLRSLRVASDYEYEDSSEPGFPMDLSSMELSFTNGMNLYIRIEPSSAQGCQPELVLSPHREAFIEVVCLEGSDGYQDSRVVVAGVMDGGKYLDIRFARAISLEQFTVPQKAVFLLRSLSSTGDGHN